MNGGFSTDSHHLQNRPLSHENTIQENLFRSK